MHPMSGWGDLSMGRGTSQKPFKQGHEEIRILRSNASQEACLAWGANIKAMLDLHAKHASCE
jgi:hypothetical protein